MNNATHEGGTDRHSRRAPLSQEEARVLEFKRRMLEWPNPVEYVNNMYGCHPADGDVEYFMVVFGP